MNNNLPDNEKALWILKKGGSLPLKEVAQEMNITVEGARFHLLKLAGEGLVRSETASKGRGRPQQIWSLTAQGHARFPDAHAELTVNMIQMVRETLGEDALQSIIKAHEKKGEERYWEELKGQISLEEKISKLVEIRSREGYMAELFKDEEGYIFVENHCPICAAAETCQSFCQSELNIFRKVLGQGVSIKRVEHIIAGARRCAYRIEEG